MMILALEFSSPCRSLALGRRPGPGDALEMIGTIADDGSKSSRPLPLLQELLTRTGVGREQVEALVVGLGPGSYTGIRSALALAQGWQLARSIRTCGVSSVEALAWRAQRQGWFGHVSIVIDAQRHEFYCATYSITPQNRQVVEPLRLVDQPALRALAAQPDTLLIGPEVTRWIPGGRILCPDAEALLQLANPAVQSVPAENLEPIYLREVTFVKAPPPRVLPGVGEKSS
jgi:tRNA threonylcarbamoyladenosine biosynthesis protein TsaB